MAATQLEARTGEKRAGRPGKSNLTPAAKKLKTTACAASAAATVRPISADEAALSPQPPPSLAVPSPISAVERRCSRLPTRVADSKPIPTLLEPQSLSLSPDEYQGLIASAVLVTSLDRSRTAWTSHGIFQRYWVKPESGKNAKPPPVDNPDVKWMKAKGECRIRLEPHVFTADVYVEERPKIPAPKQYPAYNQQYIPQPAQPSPQQHSQGRPLQSGSHPSTPLPTLTQQLPPSQLAAPPATSQTQDKKGTADPVISMLATRASSNPQLRLLMKSVATGDANPEQLRVFQQHIDELTEIIKKQRKDEESAAKAKYHDRTGESKVARTVQEQSIPQPKPYHTPHQAQQTGWTQVAATQLPLILSFKGPGASEDRFLFPQMSILEPLSPQHELVSFIVLKKGHEAADQAGLDPDREYWQPVTMMVEVAYGREEILGCIRKWAKPANEVREHMESIMQRAQRAPLSHLAFRLPYKATQAESEEHSKQSTPMVEEKTKLKPTAKHIKKLATSGSSTPVPSASKKAGDISIASTPKQAVTPTPAPNESKDPVTNVTESSTDIATDARPRRNLRNKSVRIEG